VAFIKIIICIPLIILLISGGVIPSVASTSPPPKYDGTKGVVTIAFDHGFYDQYQPMLYMKKDNFTGTVWVVTNRSAAQNVLLMPWSQLQDIYNLGFEMASHSRIHLSEANGLSNATLYSEIYGSKTDLQNQGFLVCGFVPPSSSKNGTTMSIIKKYYNYTEQVSINQNSLTTFSNTQKQWGVPIVNGFGVANLDPTQLSNLQNFTAVKYQIDKAVNNKAYLLIHFHDIVNVTSNFTGLQYPASFSLYQQVIDYLKSKSDAGLLKVETTAQALGYGQQCEIITDKSPPSISVPNGIRLVTTSTTGAQVNYTVTATDNVGLLSGPTCNPVSGSVFPKGNTTVTCRATDWAGNVGKNSFVVTIISDTIPPTIIGPSGITVQATSAAGAQVNYTVTATDNVGLLSGPTCNPTPGSVFPLGNTTVTCTASDVAGNTATKSFIVTIQDTIPPTIIGPSGITVQATSAAGAQVNYTVTATDNVGLLSGPTCNPTPGSVFPLGNTTVTCTASDVAGNTATKSFIVTIQGTTDILSMVVPSGITAEAVSAAGAQVNYTVTATDNVGLLSGPTCNPIPGSVFSLGNTTVTCTASDVAGNTATKSFVVTIQDTIPPTIIGPSGITAEAVSAAGAQVNYTVTATDNVGLLSGPTCNPIPGSVFPLGNTTVTCTASDVAGNTATKSFVVTIQDTTPPAIVAPPNASVQATGSLTQVILGTPFVSDKVDPHPVVTNNASATGYAPGTTIVVWNATDLTGNSATAMQQVAVTAVPTVLSLNTISNVLWGKTITLSGKLTNSTGGGIANKAIFFNGTGAINIPPAITNGSGFYSSSGAAPSTVSTGWTVQAHFVRDAVYLQSDSQINAYTTTKHGISIVVTTKNVPWSTVTTFTTTLTDLSNSIGISGKTIHLTGTGVIGVSDQTTDGTGKAIGTGTAPSIATGWTYQAHFTGDSLYVLKDSTINTYSTLQHATALTLALPISVKHGALYTITGTLKDSSTGTSLSSITITFTATSPIVIPNAMTDSTGKYTISNLIASSAGSYNIQSNYAGDSLYSASIMTKTLQVT